MRTVNFASYNFKRKQNERVMFEAIDGCQFEKMRKITFIVFK